MSVSRLIASRLGRNLLSNQKFTNTFEIARRGYHYAEKGGTYRFMIPPAPENNLRWKGVKAISIMVWYWIFYNLWYSPALLLGHPGMEPPDPSTFTDEELGIPPEGEDFDF